MLLPLQPVVALKVQSKRTQLWQAPAAAHSVNIAAGVKLCRWYAKHGGRHPDRVSPVRCARMLWEGCGIVGRVVISDHILPQSTLDAKDAMSGFRMLVQ